MKHVFFKHYNHFYTSVGDQSARIWTMLQRHVFNYLIFCININPEKHTARFLFDEIILPLIRNWYKNLAHRKEWPWNYFFETFWSEIFSCNLDNKFSHVLNILWYVFVHTIKSRDLYLNKLLTTQRSACQKNIFSCRVTTIYTKLWSVEILRQIDASTFILYTPNPRGCFFFVWTFEMFWNN